MFEPESNEQLWILLLGNQPQLIEFEMKNIMNFEVILMHIYLKCLMLTAKISASSFF